MWGNDFWPFWCLGGKNIFLKTKGDFQGEESQIRGEKLGGGGLNAEISPGAYNYIYIS